MLNINFLNRIGILYSNYKSHVISYIPQIRRMQEKLSLMQEKLKSTSLKTETIIDV